MQPNLKFPPTEGLEISQAPNLPGLRAFSLARSCLESPPSLPSFGVGSVSRPVPCRIASLGLSNVIGRGWTFFVYALPELAGSLPKGRRSIHVWGTNETVNYVLIYDNLFSPTFLNKLSKSRYISFNFTKRKSKMDKEN